MCAIRTVIVLLIAGHACREESFGQPRSGETESRVQSSIGQNQISTQAHGKFDTGPEQRQSLDDEAGICDVAGGGLWPHLLRLGDLREGCGKRGACHRKQRRWRGRHGYEGSLKLIFNLIVGSMKRATAWLAPWRNPWYM